MVTLKWYHAVTAAATAAGLAGLLYYLMREEEADEKVDEKKKISAEVESTGTAKPLPKLDVEKATLEQVLDVLSRVLSSQEQMKVVMKDLTREISQHDYDFDTVYEKVKLVQPQDPLEASGLNMSEFDALLDKFQNDPNVRDSIAKIMGAPAPVNFTPKVTGIKREQVIEIHEFMLKELRELTESFQRQDKRDRYDMKTVTIAAQAIVGAKVEEKFGLTSDEIESAVMLHHQGLSADADFGRISVQMQATMSDLLGPQMPSTFF